MSKIGCKRNIFIRIPELRAGELAHGFQQAKTRNRRLATDLNQRQRQQALQIVNNLPAMVVFCSQKITDGLHAKRVGKDAQHSE